MVKMAMDYADPIGLSGFLLSMNTMLMLEKKGAITHEETKEIVEQALLNLETHQTTAGPDNQATFDTARSILEGLRGLISPPSAKR
jgi:hypothetical protein